MRRFDYSFLESGLLPAQLINITSTISELKALESTRHADFTEIFESLERIAKVQSVKGSNEIEGIVTSDVRINEIVNQNSAPLNHNEAEIAGYRDVLALIHDGFERIDIRERDILQLHEMMLSYSPIAGGRYKQADNIIMEIDATGSRQVRFIPVSSAETSHAMKQLTLAHMEAQSNNNINQLLLIPCFILDFLCIHPFADGNGRMSRLLSVLLLYKNGFDAGKYISFEEQINKSKSCYYQSLKESSEGWHKGENSYFPFIENFVLTLLQCYKELDKRFAVVQGKKTTKKQRVEVTVLNSLLPISKKEISYILPDVSPTTIEAILASMVKCGAVEKIGTARNTKYIRAQK
jgi:Fic family protein